MNSIKIAIDMGSSQTRIFEKDCGLVLCEPTLIALSKVFGSEQIKAYGNEAREMEGKTSDQTVVFSPISQGEIKSEEYAATLLKYFLQKIKPKSIFSKTIDAVVCVPCALSDEQKETYARVCYKAGIASVKLVPGVITSALGGGKFVHTPTTYLIVDIGHGKTDIATVNMNTILKGCTIGVGGEVCDNKIMAAVEENYQAFISPQAAKQIKEEIGSLYERDIQNIEVLGVDSRTQAPKPIIVVADVVKEGIIDAFEKIAYAIESTINMCSPDVCSDLSRGGIFFCGGVSKISGLEDFMRKRLKLPVRIIEDPDICAVLGCGKLLSDSSQLGDILKEF